jgi:carboxylesterase type B
VTLPYSDAGERCSIPHATLVGEGIEHEGRFPRSGDPNHHDLPEWQPYSLDERATMIFDNECRVIADP